MATVRLAFSVRLASQNMNSEKITSLECLLEESVPLVIIANKAPSRPRLAQKEHTTTSLVNKRKINV